MQHFLMLGDDAGGERSPSPDSCQLGRYYSWAGLGNWPGQSFRVKRLSHQETRAIANKYLSALAALLNLALRGISD